MISKIIDIFRKKDILAKAKECGCDADGDLLVYKDAVYFVDVLSNHIVRIEKRR